jgi:hypothetical protein
MNVKNHKTGTLDGIDAGEMAGKQKFIMIYSVLYGK